MVEVKKYLKVLLCLPFFLIACGDSYEPITRNAELPTFSTIRLHSVFSVVLVAGNTYSLEITADRDIIDDIHFEVNDNALELTDKSKFKWTSPESTHIQVKITCPSLGEFIAEQSYSLTTEGDVAIGSLHIWNLSEVKISDIDLTVHGNYLFYWNNWLAGGKLIVKGKVDTFEASNYALHIIDAKNLLATQATLHNFGRESCSVNVSDRFEYSINGPGDIILYGDPPEVVLLDKSSSGKLIHGN